MDDFTSIICDDLSRIYNQENISTAQTLHNKHHTVFNCIGFNMHLKLLMHSYLFLCSFVFTVSIKHVNKHRNIISCQ